MVVSFDDTNRGWSGINESFERVLRTRLSERKEDYDSLRDDVGMYPLTLEEFFRMADALGEPPGAIFVEAITHYLESDGSTRAYSSKRTRFVRLYRLGYHQNESRFRELEQPYVSPDRAIAAAHALNKTRQQHGKAPFDTVSVYIRISCFAVENPIGR
jgi:hypothetical protein